MFKNESLHKPLGSEIKSSIESKINPTFSKYNLAQHLLEKEAIKEGNILSLESRGKSYGYTLDRDKVEKIPSIQGRLLSVLEYLVNAYSINKEKLLNGSEIHEVIDDHAEDISKKFVKEFNDNTIDLFTEESIKVSPKSLASLFGIEYDQVDVSNNNLETTLYDIEVDKLEDIEKVVVGAKVLSMIKNSPNIEELENGMYSINGLTIIHDAMHEENFRSIPDDTFITINASDSIGKYFYPESKDLFYVQVYDRGSPFGMPEISVTVHTLFNMIVVKEIHGTYGDKESLFDSYKIVF